MTILPLKKFTKSEEKPEEEHRDSESPPPTWASTQPTPPIASPGRHPSSSSLTHSPPREREKSFDSWEVERRDGGRRRRRVVGPPRPTPARPTPTRPTPRVAQVPVENRERNNSDDEYNAGDAYDLQKEKHFEALLKEKKGYIIKRSGEDGACLFRSVADQLYGDQEMHGVVRGYCMDYMQQNRDHFSQFITEDYMSYINRKRQDTCFGNQLEMQAISELYNRPIEVYIYKIDPVNTFSTHLRSEYPPIRLSFHWNLHYNSVRDPYEPSVGVGLGLPGYKPGLPDQQLLQQGLDMSESDDIERVMMEDKLESTDMEATADAITAAIARESYLEWLKQNSTKNKEQPTLDVPTSSTDQSGASSSHDCCAGQSTTPPSPPPSVSCPPPPQGSRTPPHSSSAPHSSSFIPDTNTDTLYPVYGLDDYDEEKMIEAAIALSRVDYYKSS